MTIDRRNFLRMAVTGGVIGAFTPFGGLLSPRRGRALTLGPGPKRLLTIYMPGGWQPSMMFTPFTDPAMTQIHWPSYLASPQQITNLDGSGDAPNDDDSRLPRIRTAEVWDQAMMQNPGSFNSSGTFWPDVNIASHYGYSWRHYDLAGHTCVVHGVDQQTAEHYSGRRASLCGIAGARFSAPAMHCVAADALYRSGSDRPLGAVTIKTGGASGVTPPISQVDLPAHAAPTTIAGIGTLASTFSDSTSAWEGLRHRDEVDVPHLDGSPSGDRLPLTRMDQYALGRFRQLEALSDESFYQQLYDAHVGVSRKMALDLVTILQATPGFESAPPHWVSGNPYQLQVGRVYGDDGGTWREQFDLVLKLFKADVCTAINVQAPAAYGEGFDIHASGQGPMTDLFNRTRGTCEIIGRLLGEMKATDMGGGRSLLDETLVVLISDFARSWPQLDAGNGHWPFTSYVFIGGGIQGNRMIGDYALDPSMPRDPTGVELAVDGGSQGVLMKHPAARDVARTVYRIMGIPDDASEISGGPNEILGVRAV
ncbi:MAG: DUF1501 domain-containing protein [Sandaracinaceae bacterium]